ncbi:hypothetical protein BOX15_Mlig012718g1 [Macrostomum lignano]|uniref:Uncharacterized protein n=1 Tax=Macrostomum lignano TaxID=282301 RepID=A0A267EDY1_9PLAT|nr:hypothetical protein BOX15_Mlig012718g1 [Macrostomum lignano]
MPGNPTRRARILVNTQERNNLRGLIHTQYPNTSFVTSTNENQFLEHYRVYFDKIENDIAMLRLVKKTIAKDRSILENQRQLEIERSLDVDVPEAPPTYEDAQQQAAQNQAAQDQAAQDQAAQNQAAQDQAAQDQDMSD